MRSYNKFPSISAFPATVWQAARATTSAPTFFLPIVISRVEYSDGGTGFNNPAVRELIRRDLQIISTAQINGLNSSLGFSPTD